MISARLLAFVRLAIDRGQAVSRDELVKMLWPDKLRRACDAALHSIMSKLRVLLAKAGLEKSESLASTLGCYQLQLPTDAWVDIEAASDAVHEAEGFLKARRMICFGEGSRALRFRYCSPGQRTSRVSAVGLLC